MINLSDDRTYPEQVRAAWVTSGLFSMLGYRPVLGRDLTEADEMSSSPPVAS